MHKIKYTLWNALRKVLPKNARYYIKLATLYVIDRPSARRLVIQKRSAQYPSAYLESVYKTDTIDYVPPVFVISVADNCNLRCPNCLYVLEDGGQKFFNSNFDLSKLRSVLDASKAERSNRIFLTGGEPLMHKEFDKLVDICLEYNKALSISTNGILIERHIPTLRKLDSINVSIDSYNFDTFNKYRGGNENEYKHLKRGLVKLREEGIPFSCSFVLSEENVDEIGYMLDFCAEYLPTMVHFHNINPHGSTDFTALSVNSSRVREAFKQVVSESNYDFDISLPVVFDYEADNFETRPCNQLWQFFLF